MKARFNITYSITTEASAEHGEHAYSGFLPRSGEVPRRNNMPKKPALFTLAQALDLLRVEQGPIEADSCPVTSPRWLTARHREREEGTSDYYREGPGDSVEVSLHLGSVSPASAYRIARLFKCYGLRA
jgi:hypothetical protein